MLIVVTIAEHQSDVSVAELCQKANKKCVEKCFPKLDTYFGTSAL